MIRYIVRRLILLLLVLLGASALVFLLAQAIPADSAREALGEYASNEQVEAYRQERGLDKPIVVQYVIYLEHLLAGDLGTSIVSGDPVLEELKRYLPATIELMALAVAIFVGIGVPLGIVSAVRRGEGVDQFSRLVALFGMSMPVFWLGLMLQIIFYARLGLLPLGQRLGVEFPVPPAVTGLYTIDSLLAGQLHAFWDAAKHLILPAFALSMGGLASTARITRSCLLEVLRTDYVRTARAKGLAERTVTYRHALRTALIPVVTSAGLHVGHMFGGAVLTETIFAWPGMGRWAVAGLARADLPVVMGFALFACLMYSLVNLLVDLSYGLIDPRARAE